MSLLKTLATLPGYPSSSSVGMVSGLLSGRDVKHFLSYMLIANSQGNAVLPQLLQALHPPLPASL